MGLAKTRGHIIGHSIGRTCVMRDVEGDVVKWVACLPYHLSMVQLMVESLLLD
jgi:hypothetical protein